jgi:putative DNA primase/helicase
MANAGSQCAEFVRSTTRAYFDEQDVFSHWVEECCDLGASKADTHQALYASWRSWMERQGDAPGGAITFSQLMTKPGFEPVKNTPGQHGMRGFRGISLKRQPGCPHTADIARRDIASAASRR